MVHTQGGEVVPGIKVEISIFQIIPRTEQEQFLSEESNFLRSHPSTLEQSRYKLREKLRGILLPLGKTGHDAWPPAKHKNHVYHSLHDDAVLSKCGVFAVHPCPNFFRISVEIAPEKKNLNAKWLSKPASTGWCSQTFGFPVVETMIPANEALLVGVCLQAKRSRQNGDIGLRNVQSVVLAV